MVLLLTRSLASKILEWSRMLIATALGLILTYGLIFESEPPPAGIWAFRVIVLASLMVPFSLFYWDNKFLDKKWGRISYREIALLWFFTFFVLGLLIAVAHGKAPLSENHGF